MVEKQACDVNISDTGVLSKENEETHIKNISEAQEVTDYWDISGAMETAPGSADESSGKMKLHNAAEETEIDRSDDREMQHGEQPNDNVNTDGAEAARGGNAMETYCENGQSAIDEYGPKNNLKNNTLDTSDTQHNGMSENPAATAEDMKNNNTQGNATTDQRERDTVGTDTPDNVPAHNDVSDTRPDNIDISGAQDNEANGDNKAELSIRDKMMLDTECTEERFRIDRKKLEQMLQAATEGRGQSGEEFFQKIMDDTETFITWPSKLKIGAKSKKDPHIRICGKPDNIKEARQRIMLSLDTKSNRVTIKMDVSHTEHSHVIGKGGNNIKRVMQETGCHIHFPDSNRNNATEKSNQVSITGHPEGVESARLKIRNLLPIVLQFEIPNAGVPMPDLNSPMIQHLVQVYGISIQFKQRVKVYSTSCTVRGSSDNIEGLKTGVQTLMNHVAGSQLPVTTQIEIAPQHHPYMLSKTGLNVNAIIQSTGARIIFPDPNALPKKSTVYINGSIDSVIVARHKLMGSLPLLLMFDIKADADETSHDGNAVASLMESLDIFINIKLKPKQPSKTVIIKGMEYNIYNMFDARAKLLGLDSSGITRPSHSLSPKLTGTPAIPPNPVSPVILLSRTHVTTPSVQTHIIGLTDQKAITPLPCAVLGGPGYVLTHGVTSNPGTPRPMSAVHTPSQSPYPTLASNASIVQAMTSPMHASKEALPRENAHSRTPSRDEITATYGMINHNMSPPSGIPSGQPSLRPEQKAYADSMAAQAQQRLQQQGPNVDTNVMANDSLANIRRNSNPIPDKYGYMVNGGPAYKNQEYLQRANMESVKQSMYPNMVKSPQNGMKAPYESNRTIVPPSTYNSNTNNSVPVNQYTSSSGPFQTEYHKGVHSMPGTFSPLLARAADSLNGPLPRQPMQPQLAEQQLKQPGQFSQQAVRTQEDLVRQHYSIANQVGSRQNIPGSTARTPAHSSMTLVQSSSAGNLRQVAGQNIYSPESISGSRTSLNSDAMSPMSSISDRFIENSNSRLGYEHFEEPPIRSPPSPVHQAGIFQPLVKRDLNSLSPLNTHAHRSPPHIVVNPSVDGQFDTHPALNDDPATSIADMYQTQSGGDITTRPPPGFEGFPPAQGHKDYDNLYKLAKKAMENKPVTSEIRTPTDVWAGWGFSKSMPFEMREELKKLAASKGRFKNNLPPTYEDGDDGERSQPSPVNEEDEDSLGPQYGSRLRVPFPHHTANKGGSSLKAWRQRNVMNLSLGGHMGLNFIPGGHRRNQQRQRENASAFIPVPQNESPNRHSTSPKANPTPETLPPSRPVNSSPFSSSGNERTLSFPRPEKAAAYDARMNMSSTPTIQDSLGLNANAGSKVEADISDVLNRLDLAKYTSVFQQQEVDFQTFLTLTEPDLKELGITTFGPRKKILLAIKDLNKERDVFSGPASKDSGAHENISDQMLQLQRLQLQQHRDNPQTTTPSRLDTHSLLSPSRQLFQAPGQYAQNRLDVPQQSAERRGVFHGELGGQHMPNERMRPMNASRLWQNSKAGVSNSGHW